MNEIVKTVNDMMVESSLGWSVEILSDDLLAYSEDGRTIELDIEEFRDTGSQPEWIIYWPAAWIWNGKKDDPILQKKRYDILDRIELAFWKLDRPIKEIV